MKNKQTKNKKPTNRILKFGLPTLVVVGAFALFGGGDEKRDYII